MWKNRFVYLIFLVVMGYFSLLYNNRFTLLLFLTSCALPFISLLLLAAAAVLVRIRTLPVPVTVEKGESVAIELIVENRFFLPLSEMKLNYWYRNDFTGRRRKGNVMFACGARDSGRVRLDFTADYCGNITISAEKLRIFDLTGLWSIRKKFGLSGRTAVLPERKLFTEWRLPENYAVYSEFESKNPKPGGNDPAELLSLREYAPGDKMNRIHWKKTGAMDKLLVKEFADTAQGVSVILVELRRQAPGDEGLFLLDGILEAAFSISERLREQVRPHFIAWYDGRAKRIGRKWIDSEESYYEAIGEIYGCNAEENGEEPELLYPAVYPGEQYAHIIYVGTGQAEEAAYRWKALAGASVCRLICVEGRSRILSEEAEERLRAVPIELERISLIKAGDMDEA